MKKFLMTIILLIAVMFMSNVIEAKASDNSTAVETAGYESKNPCKPISITKSKQQSVRTAQQYREQRRVVMAVSHNLKIPCNGN